MIQLTNESIKQLPEGTPITVVWPGGNGPFIYTLRWFGDTPFAVCVQQWPGIDPLTAPLRDLDAYYLDFIGNEPFTRVWVDEKYYTE